MKKKITGWPADMRSVAFLYMLEICVLILGFAIFYIIALILFRLWSKLLPVEMISQHVGARLQSSLPGHILSETRAPAPVAAVEDRIIVSAAALL